MEVSLEFLRKKIKDCDVKLLEILEERFYLVENIAKVKIQSEIPFRDYAREKKVILNQIKSSKRLRPEFIETLYILIFGENETHIKDKV